MAFPPGWVFPVPILNGTRPVVSDGFGRDKRGGRGHLGVDIMYRRAANGVALPPVMSRGFMMPSGVVPALAAGPGDVFKVNLNDPHGISVTIDHHNVLGVGPTVTVYRHLVQSFVKRGDKVTGGMQIGIIGGDPTNGAKALNHLHFELWDTSRPGSPSRESFAVDPGSHSKLPASRWFFAELDVANRRVVIPPFAGPGLAPPGPTSTSPTRTASGSKASSAQPPITEEGVGEGNPNQEVLAVLGVGGIVGLGVIL